MVELASIDTARGLSRFFDAWRTTQVAWTARCAPSTASRSAGSSSAGGSSTRRRYGALALFSDVALAGLILIVLVFPLYVARRQRDRRRLAAMVAADEAAERAARASAIEALLRGDDWPDFGADRPARRRQRRRS